MAPKAKKIVKPTVKAKPKAIAAKAEKARKKKAWKKGDIYDYCIVFVPFGEEPKPSFKTLLEEGWELYGTPQVTYLNSLPGIIQALVVMHD